jgi:hypothetical protein
MGCRSTDEGTDSSTTPRADCYRLGGWSRVITRWTPGTCPREVLNTRGTSPRNVRDSIQREREAYRERSLVESATRLQHVSARITLDMAADLIESTWSLRNAGEAALVRRRG